MIQVNDVTLRFGKRTLFEGVNIKFTKGNCYGLIGANGAGKSTFLKLLSGEIESTTGEVIMDKKERMSVLKQDQNAYNNETVLNTVSLSVSTDSVSSLISWCVCSNESRSLLHS